MIASAVGLVAPARATSIPTRATGTSPAIPPLPAPGPYQSQAFVLPFPLSQTFKLHSVPGANRVIYLDFNGTSLPYGAWNDSTVAVPMPGYDRDGNAAAFNDTEHSIIQEIWQRVSEDFAPYAIDVTTEDPGFDGINRSGAGDTKFGTRVLITNGTFIFTDCECGGIAMIDVFDESTYHAELQPAFVFQRGLGGQYAPAKYLAEAASHEAAHNLGLEHDGTTTGWDYYEGHGTWTPIMGASYDRAVSQFSKGEYGLANNHEDDFALMTAAGAPPVADEAGGTIATAANLAADATAQGIIGLNLDADMYRVTSTGGPITLTATPAAVGPNLDIRLDLLTSGGSVIATANPHTLDATLSTAVAAGTHYVRVRGDGWGDPLSNGYSRYGSVGRYTLVASGAVSIQPFLKISDAFVVEGNSGTTSATFNVSLSRPVANEVSFGLMTSAAAGDFVPVANTFTVPAGFSSFGVSVSVLGDTVPEAHEKFTATLSNPVAAVIRDGVGDGWIINDDGVGVSINDVTKLEGSTGFTAFTFTVSLTAKATQSVSVAVHTGGSGTAGIGTDFAAINQRVVFNAGEQTKTVLIVVRGDTVPEADEAFGVWLTSPYRLSITDSFGLATIRNDD